MKLKSTRCSSKLKGKLEKVGVATCKELTEEQILKIQALKLRLRLHERGFISIRFHDFKTAPKLMRFGSVYTEPFSYSLRHAEVITDQRDPSKKESTILFFSSWRNVDL